MVTRGALAGACTWARTFMVQTTVKSSASVETLAPIQSQDRPPFSGSRKCGSPGDGRSSTPNRTSAPMTKMTVPEISRVPQVSATTGAALRPAPVRYCKGAAAETPGYANASRAAAGTARQDFNETPGMYQAGTRLEHFRSLRDIKVSKGPGERQEN